MAAAGTNGATGDAFVALVRQHLGIIRRLTRIYGETLQEREDLEQEICLQLWKAFPGFAGRSRPSTWVYGVALNTAISALRRRLRRPTAEELHDVAVPGGEREAGERRDVLYAAIRRLNDGERALVLLWLEELPYEQIAEVLGLSVGAVSVRLVRAREKLRRLVGAPAPRRTGER